MAVCGVLLLSPLLAGADKRPPGMTASSIPMPSGVAGEVRVVVNAPAARVAAIASDPAAFRELFPAEEARVVGQRDGAVMVAVRKREGWPVGELRWVETVARARSGATVVTGSTMLTKVIVLPFAIGCPTARSDSRRPARR